MFAVRSGGHMPVPGAQSLDNGVMISMSKFNTQTLNEDRSIASIGPGQRWIDVYDWLGKENLAVNGGRYPSVGVGGVLLGGGIGYFSGSRGWSCDDVVAYEMVLADGRIVNVTAGEANNLNSNDSSMNSSKMPDFSDLFWALKGGHNNFGIVTRFHMRTFPMGSAFGGFTSWSGSAQAKFFDALNTYMAPGGGVDDPNSAINAFASIVPENGSASYTLANVALYPGDNPNPKALKGFSAIPSSFQITAENSVYDSWTQVPKLLSAYSNRGTRNLFWTIAYKSDPRAISIHNTTVIDGALQELSQVRGLTIYATWQPISKGWLEISQRGVGDALALDPEVDGTFIAGMITSMWEDEKDDSAVYSFVENAARKIQTETEKLGLFNPFVYLNDAAKTQKPYESLGHGKSLPKLRRIRQKYDPEGFLQKYLHHVYAYAAAGACGIVIASRSSSQGLLSSVASKAQSLNPRATVITATCDLTSSSSVASLARIVDAAFPHLDAAIVNSGFSGPMTLHVDDGDPADFKSSAEINYLGPYHAAHWFLPLLKRTNGRAKTFIAVSALAALLTSGPIANVGYCVSKMAQVRLIEMIAEQYGNEGVSAVAVHPGAVRTEMAAAAPPEFVPYLIDSPELCGGFCVWLCAEKNRSWISGRFLCANWDVEEMLAKKDEIVAKDLLKFKMSAAKQEYIPGVPIVGVDKHTTLIDARRKFRKHAKEMLLEGYAIYKGQPFYIPSPLGERLMLPPNSPILQSIRIDRTEMFEGKYTTMGDRSTLHPRVAKTHLNANLDWTEVKIADPFVTIVARVSSRMFGGLQLSRDEKWVSSAIDFATDGFLLAQKIKAVPRILRPIIARFFAEWKKISQHHETARNVITPILQARDRLTEIEEKPRDFLQWMVEEARGDEKDMRFLSKIQLKLSFAAIHTSAAAPVQLIYDLCVMPEYIETLRSELYEVLREYGILNKQALTKLDKMDSVMKESQRFNPLLLITFERIITKRTILSDGFTIPKNTTIGVPAQALSMDPDLYPNPGKFDGLRFAKTRDQYAASNLRSMAFGYGRHACPGRFFASNEIKMIMAYLLLNYDFKFPEGKESRPLSTAVETQLLPNEEATVCFKRRPQNI
ncbi:hypothetical protein FHL15_001231 [Xylaria flabelliformis]|uniref:FAD-binding PCMH-type domain-containing protein n=1 Tax=Xylaria flabelliformis TaxID=2512241 RepID=A0A553ICV1_9PEZI|nr:hypothetical protein FHL15_001231 [Xylaria flabelliformis]